VDSELFLEVAAGRCGLGRRVFVVLAQRWRRFVVSYRIIERAAIRVAYTTSIGDPSASDAFQRLEQVVPLKGNRFFATFDSLTQEYRACVALKAGQGGAWYGLPEGVLPGGTYASTKLVGPFADIVARIAPAFAQLRQEHGRDPARLPIEYYKRSSEIVLYLPVSP
jgi:hypothetical protein